MYIYHLFFLFENLVLHIHTFVAHRHTNKTIDNARSKSMCVYPPNNMWMVMNIRLKIETPFFFVTIPLHAGQQRRYTRTLNPLLLYMYSFKFVIDSCNIISDACVQQWIILIATTFALKMPSVRMHFFLFLSTQFPFILTTTQRSSLLRFGCHLFSIFDFDMNAKQRS